MAEKTVNVEYSQSGKTYYTDFSLNVIKDNIGMGLCNGDTVILPWADMINPSSPYYVISEQGTRAVLLYENYTQSEAIHNDLYSWDNLKVPAYITELVVSSTPVTKPNYLRLDCRIALAPQGLRVLGNYLEDDSLTTDVGKSSRFFRIFRGKATTISGGSSPGYEPWAVPTTLEVLGDSVFDGWGDYSQPDSIYSEFNMPPSIRQIGESAFGDCSQLLTITVPEGVTVLNDYVFASCESLTGFIIPSTVTKLGIYALGDTGLTEIIIPPSVNEIDDCAFIGTKLETVTVPSTVISLGEITDRTSPRGVFGYCNNLLEAIINANITMLPHGCFNQCTNLIDVTLPASLTTLGEQVFEGCSSIVDTSFIERLVNLQIVGWSAFSGCSGLSGNLILPSGLKTIKAGAFMDCTGLESITIPSSVTLIELSAFARVKHIYYNGPYTRNAPWGALAMN